MRVWYLLLTALVGCVDATPTASTDASTDASADASAAEAGALPADDGVAHDDASPPPPEAFCARDPRVQANAAVVERSGVTIRARREAAAPEGSARALYTWTVALRTDAGPVPDDATLSVSLRMPDHGHGARRPPTVRPLGGGRFALADLDLYMEGVWTVTLRVTANGATEQIVFGVCIG